MIFAASWVLVNILERPIPLPSRADADARRPPPFVDGFFENDQQCAANRPNRIAGHAAVLSDSPERVDLKEPLTEQLSGYAFQAVDQSREATRLGWVVQ
jgi:hypothetical protein